jgi:hypothetical protein
MDIRDTSGLNTSEYDANEQWALMESMRLAQQPPGEPTQMDTEDEGRIFMESIETYKMEEKRRLEEEQRLLEHRSLLEQQNAEYQECLREDRARRDQSKYESPNKKRKLSSEDMDGFETGLSEDETSCQETNENILEKLLERLFIFDQKLNLRLFGPHKDGTMRPPHPLIVKSHLTSLNLESSMGVGSYLDNVQRIISYYEESF